MREVLFNFSEFVCKNMSFFVILKAINKGILFMLNPQNTIKIKLRFRPQYRYSIKFPAAADGSKMITRCRSSTVLVSRFQQQI